MLVPKYDEDMLAVDDRPMVERVAEGEQARESLQVISDDLGSMGSCMGEGLSRLAIAGAVLPNRRTNPCSNA